MFVRLLAPDVAALSNAPETGQGYQVVDIVLQDGRALRNVIVLNGELADIPPSAGRVEPDDIASIRLSAPRD